MKDLLGDNPPALSFIYDDIYPGCIFCIILKGNGLQKILNVSHLSWDVKLL